MSKSNIDTSYSSRLLCTYDPNTDAFAVKTSHGSPNEVVVTAAEYITVGMTAALEQFANVAGFSKLAQSAGAFAFEFSIEFPIELQKAKETYGEDSVMADMSALGHTMVSRVLVKTGAELVFDVAQFTMKSNPESLGLRVGAAVTGAVLGKAVNDHLDQIIEAGQDVFEEASDLIFPKQLALNPDRPNSSRISISYSDPNDPSIISQTDILTSYTNPTTRSSFVTNKGSNMMVIDDTSGNEVYYFPELSGQNTINALSAYTRLVIGNGEQSISLEGNATPKTDADGNIIPLMLGSSKILIYHKSSPI